MKKVILIAVVGLILILIFNYAYTQERITLSTYYPAPYGEYRKLAIGSSTGGYTAPSSDDIDLVVEGNVGIGTTNPQAKLALGDSTGTKLLIYDNVGGSNTGFMVGTPIDGNDVVFFTHYAGNIIFGKSLPAITPTLGTE